MAHFCHLKKSEENARGMREFSICDSVIFRILLPVIKVGNKTLIMDIDSLTSVLTLGAYAGK